MLLLVLMLCRWRCYQKGYRLEKLIFTFCLQVCLSVIFFVFFSYQIEGREERLRSTQTIGVYLDFQNPIDQLFREDKKTPHISLSPQTIVSLLPSFSTDLPSSFSSSFFIHFNAWLLKSSKKDLISSFSTHISLPTFFVFSFPSFTIVSDQQRALFSLLLYCNKLLIRHHLRM